MSARGGDEIHEKSEEAAGSSYID